MRVHHQCGLVSLLGAALLALPSAARAQLLPTPSIMSGTLPGATSQPAAAAQPGIRFKRYIINDDPTYTGMEVSRGIMPADWTLKGGVVWDPRDARPAQFRVHMSDPRDMAAYDVYPNQFFYWSEPPLRAALNQADFRYMGEIVRKPPADQFEALLRDVIPRYRPDLAQARVIDKTMLKDVAKAAFDNMFKLPGREYVAAAGKVTFEYELQGQTVQEEFYVVFKQAINRQLGIMGWSVENVTSTRGPKGSLDRLNMIRAVVARSAQPNIAWFDKVTQFVVLRQKMTMKQLEDQEQRRQIFMKMKSDISDENKQAFEKHMSDIDRQSDGYGDYMREVSPWKTSDGNAVKLPTKYGHAWEGANGEILMNNDPRYNPNSDPNSGTTWKAMEQGR